MKKYSYGREDRGEPHHMVNKSVNYQLDQSILDINGEQRGPRRGGLAEKLGGYPVMNSYNAQDQYTGKNNYYIDPYNKRMPAPNKRYYINQSVSHLHP